MISGRAQKNEKFLVRTRDFQKGGSQVVGQAEISQNGELLFIQIASLPVNFDGKLMINFLNSKSY